MVKLKRNCNQPILNNRIPSKFKRLHKGLIQGLNNKNTNFVLHHGMFGLKILKSFKLKEVHINSIKQNLFRHKLLNKKQNQRLFIRGNFNIPVTRKPNEIRMGKGKGLVDHWIFRIKPGKVLFEVSTMSLNRAKLVFKIIQCALGIPTKIVFLPRTAYKLRYQ